MIFFLCAGHFLYPLFRSAAAGKLCAEAEQNVSHMHREHARLAANTMIEALRAGSFAKASISPFFISCRCVECALHGVKAQNFYSSFGFQILEGETLCLHMRPSEICLVSAQSRVFHRLCFLCSFQVLSVLLLSPDDVARQGFCCQVMLMHCQKWLSLGPVLQAAFRFACQLLTSFDTADRSLNIPLQNLTIMIMSHCNRGLHVSQFRAVHGMHGSVLTP